MSSRCCGTAGGTATALALTSCKYTSLFGVGGVNKSYYMSNKRAPSGVHNLEGENKWYGFLKEYNHVQLRCS
jgi:hypothetical protein